MLRRKLTVGPGTISHTAALPCGGYTRPQQWGEAKPSAFVYAPVSCSCCSSSSCDTARGTQDSWRSEFLLASKVWVGDKALGRACLPSVCQMEWHWAQVGALRCLLSVFRYRPSQGAAQLRTEEPKLQQCRKSQEGRGLPGLCYLRCFKSYSFTVAL